MRVLGISPLDKDATASFLEDGRVIFACGEERLSRVKLQDGFPHRAVRLGLERTGWDPASIDVVAYAFFDADEEARLIHEAVAMDAQRNRPTATAGSLRRLREARRGYQVDRSVSIHGIDTERDEFVPPKPWAKRAVYGLLSTFARLDHQAHGRLLRQWERGAVEDHRLRNRQLQAGLADYGLSGKLQRYNHHDTHAANALYASPFDEALLVTFDGYGSGNCGGIYSGSRREGIRSLHRYSFPNSLGLFYEFVTSALGFTAGRHEGKIVGLAAYGDPEILKPALLERFDCHHGEIVMRASQNYFFTRALAQHFAKRDVAAAYQRVLEEVGVAAVAYWVKQTGLTKIAVSGGVHANVKFNQRLREIPGVAEVYVYPNMGDGGCGTGAAMLAFGPGAFARRLNDDVYYGPDFSEAEIETELKCRGLAYDRCDAIEDQVARLLVANRIVGRFDGRMEYGPRALGNRSILYPAQDPEVNQWLNHQLGRTEFMPFAPAALASEAGRLFKNIAGCETAAHFMTITFDCTEAMRRMCPAAVHVDGTARPQLVSERSNPGFHRVLRGYYELSGVPALINTSFNMHEEPIVCSPADAVRAFLQGRLDYLAIGPFLVPHPRLTDIEKERESLALRA
ncbi:MAG TPA: carbamoyltransferase C-terminal domain-containing protein [Pirellulales bacterium]|nr:carbamoyltransferase C-terminal domain-containing protein [Pirellulales bacterium]